MVGMVMLCGERTKRKERMDGVSVERERERDSSFHAIGELITSV